MITLAHLEAVGCYLNAGHLDHYNGYSHTRIADVTMGGDLVYEPGGETYAGRLLMDSLVEAMADPVPAKDEAPASVDEVKASE